MRASRAASPRQACRDVRLPFVGLVDGHGRTEDRFFVYDAFDTHKPNPFLSRVQCDVRRSTTPTKPENTCLSLPTADAPVRLRSIIPVGPLVLSILAKCSNVVGSRRPRDAAYGGNERHHGCGGPDCEEVRSRASCALWVLLTRQDRGEEKRRFRGGRWSVPCGAAAVSFHRSWARVGYLVFGNQGRTEHQRSGGKTRLTNAQRREGLCFRLWAVFQRGRPEQQLAPGTVRELCQAR